MEERMEKLKASLSEGELADFIFTEEMRKNVIQKTKMRSQRKKPFFSSAVPMSLSAVAVLLFSAGIYYVASNGLDRSAVPNPGRSTEPDVVAPKPVLVSPAYVPEGYVFKHTKTDKDYYEHVYVHETNSGDYFSYRMQAGDAEAAGEMMQEIRLAEGGLTGREFLVSENQRMLVWEDEGFYQIVEQAGGLSEIDFYRIVDSILAAKGKESLVGEHIRALEAALAAEEAEKARMAFDEEKAVALLVKYEETMNASFADSDYDGSGELKFKTFKTKEDFYAQFTDFMSKDYVEWIFSIRIEEKDDGLYHLPMDGPPGYWPENPYEFEKISDTEYRLTQYQEGDMNGKQNIRFLFKYTDGKWIIDTIQVQQL